MLAFFLQDFFCSRSAYAKNFGTIKGTKLSQLFCANWRVNETGHIFDWKHGEMLPFFLQDFFWSRSASEKKKLGP